MKSFSIFLFRLILIIGIAVQFTSCQKDCGPTMEPLLTDKEKAFIPNQVGDTLHFKDNSGKEYFLVCKNKELSQSGYSHTGHNNPCEDTDIRWDKLSAHFEGNILNDHNQPIFLQTRIEGGYQPNDPGGFDLSPACNSNYKCFFYLIFTIPHTTTYTPQTYWGRTAENLFPVIINYGFKSEVMLGGQLFQKINTNSISTTCSGAQNLAPTGLDSVYYSTQYGLVRFTTVGGKKYQRVL